MYPLSSITSILSINGWEMVSNVFAVATNRQLDRSTGTLTGRSKVRENRISVGRSANHQRHQNVPRRTVVIVERIILLTVEDFQKCGRGIAVEPAGGIALVDLVPSGSTEPGEDNQHPTQP